MVVRPEPKVTSTIPWQLSMPHLLIQNIEGAEHVLSTAVSKVKTKLFDLTMLLLFLKEKLKSCTVSLLLGLVNTVSYSCNCSAFNTIHWPCWPWANKLKMQHSFCLPPFWQVELLSPQSRGCLDHNSADLPVYKLKVQHLSSFCCEKSLELFYIG